MRNYKNRWYNGFSPKDRAVLSKPQRYERYSRGNNPTVCCVTGFTKPEDPKGAGYMFTHLEDYRNPLAWIPMSKRAHYVLHRRFVDPHSWLRLVAKHYVHGAWFTLLTLNVEDMYRPFDEVYPKGLPGQHELWPNFADELRIESNLYAECNLSELLTLDHSRIVGTQKPE